MRPRSWIVAAGLAIVAGPASAQESPLLGKELERLELSHPLQGDRWTLDDLHGSVVVLDVFQLG